MGPAPYSALFRATAHGAYTRLFVAPGQAASPHLPTSPVITAREGIKQSIIYTVVGVSCDRSVLNKFIAFNFKTRIVLNEFITLNLKKC